VSSTISVSPDSGVFWSAVMTTKSTEVRAMCVMVMLCFASGRVGDWYHCLELCGEGSMYEELYGTPPSIENKAHWDSSAGGEFPRKAIDVPVDGCLIGCQTVDGEKHLGNPG